MWKKPGVWLALALAFAQWIFTPAARAAAGSTGTAMTATSPFTDYTAASVAWVLIIAFLVAVLLIGGILIVNLGLMSKRPEDHVGGRTPSDVGILKHNVWPEEASESWALPAEDEAEDKAEDVREDERADGSAVPPEGASGMEQQGQKGRSRDVKRPA